MTNIIKYTLATFFGSVLGVIAGIVILISMAGLLIGGFSKLSGKPVQRSLQNNSILVLDLSDKITERTDSSIFGPADTSSLHELTDTLKQAGKDDKVKGMLIKTGYSVPMGWSTAKELRDLLEDFKNQGKKLIAYGEVISEKGFYISSVAEKIYMHPTGRVGWDGFAATPMFFKGLFDKLKLEPLIFRAGRFKSAIEPFTRKDMSDENRQQTEELIEDLWEETVETFADSRNLDLKAVRDFAETAEIRSAKEAVEAGFIDEVKIYSEVVESFLKEKDEDSNDKLTKKDFKRIVSLRGYINLKSQSLFASLEKKPFLGKVSSKNRIAVVVIEGAIMPGKSGEDTVGSESVLKHLRKVRMDKKVKGVIIRVNSPGGSALASDVIWREIKKLREVKPVYASLGDIAASGGYYVAVGAEKIFSEINTITGSIGVYSILYNIRNTAQEKLGLTFDRVVTNPFADLGSGVRGMTLEEKSMFQSDVERTYNEFLGVVQQGRQMESAQDVDALAQGRVWSGSQAKEIGLVDEIGGIRETAEAMADALEIGEYDLTFYPKRKSFEDIVEEFLQVRMGTDFIKNSGLKWAKEVNRLRAVLSVEGPLLYHPYALDIN